MNYLTKRKHVRKPENKAKGWLSCLKKGILEDGSMDNVFTKDYPIVMQPKDDGSGNVFIIYLYSEIKEPATMAEVISVVTLADENDVIVFQINTPGGRIDTTLSLVSAIRQSPAMCVGVLQGVVASAGTTISLALDDIQVDPFVEFMIHTASYGSGGKTHEVYDHVQFTDKVIKEMLTATYKHFLSKKELKRVLRGDDIYLTSDEVVERWQKVLKARAKLEDKYRAEAEAQELEGLAEILRNMGYSVTKE